MGHQLKIKCFPMEFKLSMSNILLVTLRAAKISQLNNVSIERRVVASYFDSQLFVSVNFQMKMSDIYSMNVRICGLSLSYMIVNEDSLGLVG